MNQKASIVFMVITAFFITNSLLAEFIGVKIFSLEETLGFQEVSWSLLGIEKLSFNLTAGALLWPFVFIFTDIANEYFGKKGVRQITFLAASMIAYSFLMISLSIGVSPSDFWVIKQSPKFSGGVINMNDAFTAIFGQGQWIIIGSLVAFVIGQLIDASIFHRLRLGFGRNIWIRATVSTLVSQLVDSFVVLYIAFGLGAGWDLKLVFAIGIVNYVYKALAAIVFVPFILLIHKWIDNYLGKELSAQLIAKAEKSGRVEIEHGVGV